MSDLYKTLLKAHNEAGEGFLIAEGERILYANDACTGISGYSVDELLDAPSLFDLISPDQRDLALSRFQKRVSSEHVTENYESAIVHKSGRRVEVEVAVKLLRDDDTRRLVLVRDVTERKQVERALRESEKRFRQLFEQSVDAVLVHDETGRMIDCNSEACRSLGYSREELLSLSVKDLATDLVSESEKQTLKGTTLWERSMKGEPGTGAEGLHYGEHRRKDGASFPVEVRVGAANYGGKPMILASARDISERQRAVDALRESEERFRSLVQNASDVITVFDAAGTINYESPSVERVLGYQPEELVGTNVFDYIHPEDLEHVRETFAEGLRTTGADKVTTGRKLECRVWHADGSWRSMEALASNLLAEPGVEGIVINFRDVTERRRAGETLRRQNEYLNALHETSLALMNRLEIPDLLEAVVARAGALMDTSHGYVYLLGPKEAELEMQVGTGVFEDYLGYRIKPGEGVSGRVWESGQPVVVEDYRTWSHCLPQFSRDIHAIVGVPLKSGSETVGVIGLAYLEDGRTFEKDKVDLLSRFAELVSVALDNARLYTNAQRELNARELAEGALRDSEEQYRMLVETVQEGIGFVDERETITYCNQAYAAIFDTVPQKLTGRSLLEFLDDHERVKAEEQTALHKNGVRSSYEISIKSPAGTKELSASGAPIMKADGSYQGAVHTIIDITEQKQSVELLRQRSAAMATSMDGMAILDKDGLYTYMNSAHAHIFGYEDPKDLSGKSWSTLYNERELKAFEVHAVPTLSKTGSWQGEAIGRRRDGSEFPQELSLNTIDGGGHVCVVRDITERKVLEKRLAYQAFHDPLTELPNRTLFMDRLEHALARGSRRKDLTAVMFMDLDDFKIVNDSLGHKVGDHLLVAIASRLQPCLRPGDTVARLGGDEFTVLLERIDGEEEATRIAKRISDAMRAPFELAGRSLFVTFSIGIALSAPDLGQPMNLLRDADLAMYGAKDSGKDRYRVFDPAMNTRALERLELGNDLRLALERDEFKVCYQPKVRLTTGETIGFEALVRWNHPKRGLVSPEEFVPVAEETGLILPIGQKVLQEACSQAREWRQRYPETSPLMSVNLSAKQFQNPKLAQEIAWAIEDTTMKASTLCLEITESVVMQDAPHTAATFRQLKELGVQFSIDDFGTGYSSLAYLKRFPVAFLKIDRSFIVGLEDDPEDVAVVSGIIALAHTLGIEVVAEGVETAEQAARLRELECDMAQGNYFFKPLPVDEAADLLTDAASE